MADIHNNLSLIEDCISKMMDISDDIQDTTTFVRCALVRSDIQLSGKRQEMTREAIADGIVVLQSVKDAIDCGRKDLEKLKDCLEIYLSLKFQE